VGVRQTVLFCLENNLFGIPIANVQEIVRTPVITAIPNTPAFFKGVINLRDKVIPVLGLAGKLGLKESAGEDDRTVIVNVGVNTAGIVVDDVCDVLKIDDERIETAVNLYDTASRAISGIAKLDDRLVILLNLDELLASDEVFNFGQIYKAIEEYFQSVQESEAGSAELNPEASSR
jgi:purine-binding chemotaxis protein CheW